MKSSKFSGVFKVLVLAVPVSTVCLAGMGPSVQAAEQITLSEARQYSIAPGPLGQVLNEFSLQAGIDFSMDASLTAQQKSTGVSGTYRVNEALDVLLKGTALVAQKMAAGSFVLKVAPIKLGLQTVIVHGKSDVDEDGYNAVFDKNTSSAFMGKRDVERFKGTNPSDLLQGVAGVFSGESRNSGALDLNIRGIQGPGRVPVSIDGTEQALTVWRGYNGATNRNYIDPNLISNIQIYKGATNERDVNSGVGGAMVIKTLAADDIVKEGESFGVEWVLEGSSNAIKPRVPRLHTGEKASDIPGFPSGFYPYTDPSLLVGVKSKSASDQNPLSGADAAYRLAVAKKTEDFDLLAAYAYRKRGNYYSGSNNSDYYSQSSDGKKDYVISMANFWKPGDEVTNTSSEMESLLLKANFHLYNDQQLSFGFRQSQSSYGEIMPSRINTAADRASIQWPLSKVDAKAYNITYNYKPLDNSLVDFNANLWRTDTVSDTYSAGGFPNQNLVSDPDGTLYNTAIANARNIRDGISLSNKMQLSDSLDLTLGANFQHEKLSSVDEYEPRLVAGRSYPRAGRREEWQTNFDLSFQPVDKFKINAGMSYSAYWAYDDFLAAHPDEFDSVLTEYFKVVYSTETWHTDSDTVHLANIASTTSSLEDVRDLLWDPTDPLYIPVFKAIADGWFAANLATALVQIEADRTRLIKETNSDLTWKPDEEGNYSREDFACLNGELDDLNVTSCRADGVEVTQKMKAEKKSDHGWVPHLMASYQFSDYSRAYFKYSETLRFPSMFESTIAFSASQSLYDLKPEHAYNWELAYVHDLTQWLPNAEYADIKLAYYENLTRDVIERDSKFKFNNIDKQKIRGLELDFRYDNGRFFTGLGVNYNLQNEICDEDTAAMLSRNNTVVSLANPMPDCFKYGFPNGYQLAQATPDLSANLSLGGRFLERRLEVGGRVTYYKGYDNEALDWYAQHTNPGYVYFYNTPFSWGETLLFDAYARYKINDGLDVEFVGTNLTDQYYVDPSTRTAIAAPGRTVKLSLTGRF